MERKVKACYDICMDFWELPKKPEIKAIVEESPIKIRDIEISLFIVDSSNPNTQLIRFKGKDGKSVVVCGDFRNYDGVYKIDKLNQALSIIREADIMVVEGKYLGKEGLENSSGKEIYEKLKNIMKFYKQIFIIQSETDLIMASSAYQAALKTRKIFVENTLLCNLASIMNGSCPSPLNAKKVYSYNPLVLENRSFEFKKKYVAPFYINSAISKLKKEKYVMNITKEMLQDIQVFEKEGSFYDACVIMAEWKGFIAQDEELEEFINILKNYDMDYYELYTHGRVGLETLKKIIFRLKPQYVIPIDFSGEKSVESQIYNLKILKKDDEMEI